VLGQFRPYSDPHIPNPARDSRVRINVGIIELPDAATIGTDGSEGNIFRVTIAGSRAFANPTNLVDGATYMWIIKEDSTGGYTPTFGSVFDFATPPAWNTAADAVNIVSGVYEGGYLRVVHNKGW
jgi:hypothetical protein